MFHRTELARKTRGKSILVTSRRVVGSELVRQLLKQAPRRIVLFDNSEVALYEIEDEISEFVKAMRPELPRPEIVGVLGSVLDTAQVRETLAATGHLSRRRYARPIVEQNPSAAEQHLRRRAGRVCQGRRRAGAISTLSKSATAMLGWLAE
jgi:hypothetical protein